MPLRGVPAGIEERGLDLSVGEEAGFEKYGGGVDELEAGRQILLVMIEASSLTYTLSRARKRVIEGFEVVP